MTPLLPDAAVCLTALEVTWPTSGAVASGPFTLRDWAGGGKRVSAAAAEDAVTASDLDTAEAAQRAAGMRPLFRLRPEVCPWDERLDADLAARGYRRFDSTSLLATLVEPIMPREPSGLRCFPVWPPLAIQNQLWVDAGIGPAHQAIMARVKGPKTALLARIADRAAGVAFVACDGPVAVLHVMETMPLLRRKGAARNLMHGAAAWAAEHGAQWLALAVTEANAPARALYEGMGLQVVTRYHYCEAPAPKA